MFGRRGIPWGLLDGFFLGIPVLFASTRYLGGIVADGLAFFSTVLFKETGD